MEEKNNQEMSVDELLERLSESLKEDTAKKPHKEEDDEIAAVVEEALSADAEAAEAEEPAIEEAAEEAVAEVLEEEAQEPEEEVAPAIPAVNEEDIFAAWGINKEDVERAEPPEEMPTAEEYVAPITVATKIYYITRTESKTEYSLRKQAELEGESVEKERTDITLIGQALGIEKAEDFDETTTFTPVFEEDTTTEPKTIDEPHAEFTYQRQKDDILADYKKASKSSFVKLVLTAVFAAILFVIECLPALGVAMPDIFCADGYPVVYAMTMLQLVWLAAAISYKEIANGALSLLKLKITSGTILGILVLVSTIYSILVSAVSFDTGSYNFSVVLCALFVRFFDYFDIRREVLAFEIASSVQSKKYVAIKVPEESASQIEGLEDYSGEDSLILRTERCSFVENYFSRTSKRSENDVRLNKYLVPVMLAVAVISTIISLVNGDTGMGAASAFYAALSIGLPVLVLLASTYPFYRAVNRLYSGESTIVGEGTIDEYAGTTMICFDDADAYPSYGVSLESLRIYGDGDIETIIEQMGAVYSKLGGPLKNVFTLMTSDCPKPYKVKIEAVYNDGIHATVDGKTLFIGTAAYLAENGILVGKVESDSRFSTVFLAESGMLRAKFYIRYTLDGSFETMVKKLARHGIASVILTGDSSINDELLSRSIDISKLPVKVIKRGGFDGGNAGDRADSGIVSRGSVGDLVNAVTMCDRLAGVIGTMRSIRIAASVICAFLVIGTALLNLSGTLSSMYVTVYHLFWFIPAWLIAKFNL